VKPDQGARTVGDLVADLRQLGVREGDALMIHGSLRRIGPVEGGATGVLDALDAVVGPGGTLMMTLGLVVPEEWVNQRPEAERESLLADAPPYDIDGSVLPEVGWLAEVFRQRAGSVVSQNPSGRFGARGRDAEALLQDAPWDDYYGPDSPLDRLCRMHGRVLRLGADPATVTVLHYAEYLADVPNKRTIRRHYRARGPAGAVTRSITCLDDEHGIVEAPGEDYFARITTAYIAAGRAKTGMVGNALSELIEAKDIVAFGTKWMSEHLPQWADRSSDQGD
jgi:aminoglycoside 3-N-acetyltransferase